MFDFTSRIGIARSLEFEDIISEGYDKMHPPKENDEATVVRFHVAVNGLDSINEYSMVTILRTGRVYHHF